MNYNRPWSKAARALGLQMNGYQLVKTLLLEYHKKHVNESESAEVNNELSNRQDGK
jgi:hypothetical protein